LVLAVAGGAFIVLHSASPASRHITGTFVLYDTHLTGGIKEIDENANCEGARGYSDISPGVSALIKDESGKVIGSAVLPIGGGYGTKCSFDLDFGLVTDDAKFYVFNVAGRGDVSYSHDQLASKGWTVSLSLGD
jgi:hypothetical protein